MLMNVWVCVLRIVWFVEEGYSANHLLLAIQVLARGRLFWPAKFLSGFFRHFSLTLLTAFRNLSTVFYRIRFKWENRMRKKRTETGRGIGIIIIIIIGFVVWGSSNVKLAVVSVVCVFVSLHSICLFIPLYLRMCVILLSVYLCHYAVLLFFCHSTLFHSLCFICICVILLYQFLWHYAISVFV